MKLFYTPTTLFLVFHLTFSGFLAIAQNQSNTGNFQTSIRKETRQLKINKQTPGNQIFSAATDACSGAVDVPLNVQVAENNIGATQSLPPNECNGSTAQFANDVWFKFTYSEAMDTLKVVPTPNVLNDIVVELFSGSCSNPVIITCADFSEPDNPNQTEGFLISALGLNVGTTYYFRVFGYSAIECNFYALIKTVAGPVPVPPNDACTTASALAPGVTRSGTTIGATQTLAPCDPSSNTSNDVWYSFTKTATTDSLIITPSSSENFAIDLRSNNCTAGTSIFCVNNLSNGGTEKIALTAPLVNGTVYFVRVYGVNGSVGDFNIRIKVAPANNNCSGAITLIPTETCTFLNGTTVDANQSLPAITCNNVTGNADDDVWYRFDMIEGLDTIRVTSLAFFDAVVDLRSGTCSSSTNIRCADQGGTNFTEKIYVGNLTLGTSYFVRIYGKQAGFQGAFRICLTQGALTPPANDNCTSPIVISGAALINGSSVNATQTLPSPGCGGQGSTTSNDVWFRFTKSASIDSIAVDGLGALDVLFDVRTNICTTGVLSACYDKPGDGLKKTDVSFLIDGTTYLFRVYGRNGTKGEFTIQLLDANTVVTPPANDECFDATQLTVGGTCSSTAATSAGATEDSNGLIAGPCSGANPGSAKDVWFKFTAASTRAIARLSTGVSFDGAIQVYSGSCFAPVPIACADAFGASNDPDFPSVEDAVLTGLTSGQTYLVRVYGKNGATGDFSICIFNPTCNSVASALVTNTTSIVSNQAFTTTVTGVTETYQYQLSNNQTVWTPTPSLNALQDTIIGRSSAVNSILYIRIATQNGGCFPVYSNVVAVNIRCASPFSNAPGTNFISNVTLGTINQNSTVNPLGGNVQDFSQLSTGLCKGSSYPLGITSGSPNTSFNRMAWIDFNQDGDFADAGENVLNGPYVSGALITNSIAIPANATIGSSRLRIALINNGASINSNSPCATGPYTIGEIEEYTVNITESGVQAVAGIAQTICENTATLAATNPGVGISGVWSVVSGTGIFANVAQNNTTVSGLSAGANVFKWTITTGCGSSNANVTITSSNLGSIAGPDQTLCGTNSGTLNATVPTGGSGIWTSFTGGGALTTPTAANSAITNLGIGINSFIWTVTPSAPGCPVARDTVRIIRKNTPTAVVGNNQALCTGIGTLLATTPTSGTGVWSLVSGLGNITNVNLINSGVTGLGFGANTFQWTVSDAPCTPVSANMVLTNNLPGKPNVGQDQIVCSQAVVINLSATNVQTGLNGIWSVISGSGSISNPQNPSTTVNEIGLNQNKFAFTISVPACTTNVADTILITRENNPINLGKDTLVCQTGVNTYPLAGPAGMSSYTWSNNQTSQQITVSGNGTYSLSVLTPVGCTFKDTVNVSFCVGTDKAIYNKATARIFPNPSFGSSNLELSAFTGKELQIEVLDMKGSVLKKSQIRVLDETSTISLPEELQSGVYHLRISGKNFQQNIKWIVQK